MKIDFKEGMGRKQISIAVTGVCNFTCEFCYRGNIKEISLDEALEVSQYGDVVSLGGGEPTIWRHLFDFVKRVNKPVGITTNGWWAGKPFQKKLENLPVMWTISCYGVSDIERIVKAQKEFGKFWNLNFLVRKSEASLLPEILPELRKYFPMITLLRLVWKEDVPDLEDLKGIPPGLYRLSMMWKDIRNPHTDNFFSYNSEGWARCSFCKKRVKKFEEIFTTDFTHEF